MSNCRLPSIAECQVCSKVITVKAGGVFVSHGEQKDWCKGSGKTIDEINYSIKRGFLTYQTPNGMEWYGIG